jgi:hypothetical protein
MRTLSLACAFVVCASCAVAPVRTNGSTAPPPTWTYAGVHGRPLAFHGGVCTVNAPHKHNYPPSPRAAFEQSAAGWFDTRPVTPFFDAHPHHGRTCHLRGWHLHLEGADPGLTFDDAKNAWRR